MSTLKSVRDLNIQSIDEYITDLENARSAYDNEEEAAFCASMIFTWFGLIGGPAGVCVTASILNGALSYYYDTVENAITKTINELEDYKDFLQSNSNYNLVRMEVTAETKSVNGTTYSYPTDFNAIAIHSINPSGWVTL